MYIFNNKKKYNQVLIIFLKMIYGYLKIHKNVTKK